MEQNKKQNFFGKSKTLLAALLALVVLALLALGLWRATRKPAAEGEKSIVVAVRLTDGSETDFPIQTDEQTLRGALEQEHLIEGTESEYGLFVTSVNGIAADDSKQEWWCFTQNDVSLETGVDSTMLQDGDHYEITLTVGY